MTPLAAVPGFLARQSTKQHRGAPFTSWRKVERTALAPKQVRIQFSLAKTAITSPTHSYLSVLRSILKGRRARLWGHGVTTAMRALLFKPPRAGDHPDAIRYGFNVDSSGFDSSPLLWQNRHCLV